MTAQGDAPVYPVTKWFFHRVRAVDLRGDVGRLQRFFLRYVARQHRTQAELEAEFVRRGLCVPGQGYAVVWGVYQSLRAGGLADDGFFRVDVRPCRFFVTADGLEWLAHLEEMDAEQAGRVAA